MALTGMWLTGVESGLPTAGVTARLYFATDTSRIFLDIGAAWVRLNLIPRGIYAGGTTYYEKDLVTYNGSVWRALATVTGVTPVEGANWTLFVSKGDVGTSDHGALTGLGDDDHTQYHTDARGDARYVNETDFTATAVVGKFTGTPNGTKFLRDDGALAAGAGGLAAASQPETDAGTLDTVALTPLKDATKVRAKRKFSTGSSALTAEGERRYDSTRKLMAWHEGVRERALSSIGYMPFAYPLGGGPTLTTTTNLGLVVDGGTIAIPMQVVGHMLLESVSYWDVTAANAKGPVEFALYEDRLNNANALDLVPSAVGTLAVYTPTVASLRTISVTSPPIYLAPGCYWLTIKNNNASFNLGLGGAVAGTMAVNHSQTKTLTTAAFGSTLDFVAATWTKINNVPGVRLNGRSFGQSAAF